MLSVFCSLLSVFCFQFIFAQIHRSSNRWQLPAIVALSQYPYRLFGSLRLVEVRVCGIRPCCPRLLVAQRTGIGHIFHSLSYLALF